MTSQPDIWARLAEPFPPSEVKQRPGAAKYPHKDTCEGSRCRETRDESKHLQLSYVDARAVAQRLDDVLTPRGWEFTCAVIPGSDIVKGTLKIREIYENVEDFTWTTREDHGYPNSDRDEEPIKAATSDALKRCAVLFGVGRHLYDDNHRPSPAAAHSSPAANGAAAGRLPLRPAASTVPPALEEPEWFKDGPQPVQNGHSAATAGSDERMTSREIFAAAEAAGITKAQLGATAKRVFGGEGMITKLDDEQRAVVWAEVAR